MMRKKTRIQNFRKEKVAIKLGKISDRVQLE